MADPNGAPPSHALRRALVVLAPLLICAAVLLLLLAGSRSAAGRTHITRAGTVPPPPSLTLAKTISLSPVLRAAGGCPAATELLVPAGTVVYYCYSVHNNGPLLLPKHQLYDDELDRDILPADFLYDLMPGETLTTRDLGVVVSRQVTQSTYSFALWQAYVNDVVYAQAGAHARVRVGAAATTARLTVGAASGPACPPAQYYEGAPGSQFALCLSVRNSGTVSLTQHIVDVPALALHTTLARTLAPGALLTLTAANLPGFGPLLLTQTRSYTVTVTSTANPSGAPFSAAAQSSALAAPAGAAARVWLPTVRR